MVVDLSKVVAKKRAILIAFDDLAGNWESYSVGEIPISSGSPELIVKQLTEVLQAVTDQAYANGTVREDILKGNLN